ncbi:MAG: hypothetical protein RBG13Loki_3325 [Promethearchaeota archaeon CR_4]|nr:MAG: hypothetical protein RBG13Loki_3325 [Candidatus Lokiarchaeota archaeon CR_4]
MLSHLKNECFENYLMVKIIPRKEGKLAPNVATRK